MKKIFLSIGLFAIFLFIGIISVSIIGGKREVTIVNPLSGNLPNEITVGDSSFKVELATTLETRTRGLSNRAALPQNNGMLFAFNKPGTYGFWMKDMKFPLDIIWIADRKVAGFEKNVQPAGNNPKNTYFPPTPVTEVLEINAGLVDSLGIKAGDVVKLGYKD